MTRTGMPDVLVIDDDSMMLEIMADMLGDAGCEVRMALDGSAGLEAIAEAAPALIVLDLNMPVMDGFEVARRVRANSAWAGIPILAVSGDDTAEGRNRALGAGCTAMLAKPVDADALTAQLHALLVLK